MSNRPNEGLTCKHKYFILPLSYIILHYLTILVSDNLSFSDLNFVVGKIPKPDMQSWFVRILSSGVQMLGVLLVSKVLKIWGAGGVIT